MQNIVKLFPQVTAVSSLQPTLHPPPSPPTRSSRFQPDNLRADISLLYALTWLRYPRQNPLDNHHPRTALSRRSKSNHSNVGLTEQDGNFIKGVRGQGQVIPQVRAKVM